MADPTEGCCLAGYIERSAEYISDDHSHDFWQIIIVLGGTFMVSFDGLKNNLSTGWVHILPPGKKHTLQSGPEGYSQIGIDIVPDSSAAKELEKNFGSPTVFRSSDAEWLGYVIRDNIRTRVSVSERLIGGCVQSVLTALIAEKERAAIDPAAKKLSEWIDIHLADHVTLEELSAEMFLSVPHLERICRKNYGCGVITLYNKRRFEKAASYLLGTRMTIGEIAELVGFDEVSNFSAFFRNRAGVSPRIYRKK